MISDSGNEVMEKPERKQEKKGEENSHQGNKSKQSGRLGVRLALGRGRNYRELLKSTADGKS